MLQIWNLAIPLNGKILTKEHRVYECFNEDDINREFVHKLTDGTIFWLPRKKPMLKMELFSIFSLSLQFNRKRFQRKRQILHLLGKGSCCPYCGTLFFLREICLVPYDLSAIYVL